MTRMTNSIKTLTLWITLTALLAALAGCCKSEKRAVIGITDNDVYPYENGKIDPYVEPVIVVAGVGPSPSEGILPIPVSSFGNGNNGQSCFPTAAGWNKYYVTFYFLGPNVSPPPNPNTYPNPENLNSVTIDTMLTENGATLDTGIVIMDNLNPNNKVCNDDASPPFAGNAKLSKATFTPTGSGKKYRVTVFYKSSTIGGLSQVKMHWKYP